MLDGALQDETRPCGASERAPAARVGWNVFGVTFVGLFAIALVAGEISTTHHDVTEIAMWSGAGWQLGFWKHPPLLPWLFRAAFSVFGESRITIAGLTAANVTIGAWAVWRIARLCMDEARAARALGLYALSPLVTVLALKLNHNAILVSLWPLTVLAFLQMLRSPTVLNGALLGLTAGLAMLAKYYSGLLLLSCFVSLLASPARGRVLRSPAPWIAAVAGIAVWSPNLWWIAHNGLQPIHYAMTPEKVGPLRFIAFGAGALGLLSPVVIAAAWVSRRSGASLFRSNGPLIHGREIAIVSTLPFLLTMALTYLLTLRGATLWALPIFSLVPILLAARLPPPQPRSIGRVLGKLPVLLLALLPLTLLVELYSVRYGATAGEPRAEIAAKAESYWRAAVGKAPIRYVAGDTRLISEATLSLADHPVGWPNFDVRQAEWIAAADITANGLLALCRAEDKACRSQAAAMQQTGAALACELTAVRKLGPISGPEANAVAVIVAPAGHPATPDILKEACVASGGHALEVPPAKNGRERPAAF